jgi:hypothetical protein
MPDERQESTAQGIAPAPESEIGRKADARRREQLTHEPESARPDSGMGGTSDGDTAADEAWTPPPGRGVAESEGGDAARDPETQE